VDTFRPFYLQEPHRLLHPTDVKMNQTNVCTALAAGQVTYALAAADLPRFNLQEQVQACRNYQLSAPGGNSGRLFQALLQHGATQLGCNHWRHQCLLCKHTYKHFVLCLMYLRLSTERCRNEFRRAGVINFPALGATVVDSFRLFCSMEPRSLGAAVSFYCGRSHAGAAHTALADAQATLAVLVEQVRTVLSCGWWEWFLNLRLVGCVVEEKQMQRTQHWQTHRLGWQCLSIRWVCRR
jgi:hypothetical protein